MPLVTDTQPDNIADVSESRHQRSSDLARVCLDAARSLASIGYNASKSDRSVNNMCLLKAWIFAAGLLLGFWLFCQCETIEADVDEAFQQSISALKQMAAFSPQAGHYYEILSSLSNAIDAHRSKKAQDRKRLTSRYVDQVLTFGMENGNEALGKELLSDDAAAAPGYGIQSPGSNVHPPESRSYSPPGLGISEGFPWPADDLDIDWQPFAPFLDDLG